MDARYIGTNLLALDKKAADRRNIWTDDTEDAYYEQHAPAEQRRIPRIAFAFAGVTIGLVALGVWPS